MNLFCSFLLHQFHPTTKRFNFYFPPHYKPLERGFSQNLIERSPDTNRAIKKIYHQIWGLSERRILAKETMNQIKILLGKNQRIAVKRAQGKTDLDYKY